MKNLINCIATTLTLINIVACGNLPQVKNLEQDKSEAQNQVSQLSKENAEAKAFLQRIRTTDNYLWFIARGDVSFEEAKLLCENFGYQLPSEAALAEFDAQIMQKDQDWLGWQKSGESDKPLITSPSGIHVTPEREVKKSRIALCMTPKTV